MADVALSGEALVRDVTAAELPEGRAAFWWLGQHSFILKIGGRVVYIDPYLEPSPARQTPPLLTPEQVTNADVVLCTHDHGDHIDPYALPGIALASQRALFVAPRPHRERMLDLGVPPDRLRHLGHLDTALGDVTLTGVKAKHEFFHEGPEGFPFMGYVVEGGGVTCYHSGDTLVYDGLLPTLQRWRMDAVFLPINGRDALRYRTGCIGNMTYQEAVDLAGELKARLAVPSHWDMFASNSEDPGKFVDYMAAKFPGVRTWVGRAGERVEFGG